MAGGFLSPNGTRMSPKETMGVCIWMWTENGRQHHVQTTITHSARGHQVWQLSCTINHTGDTNSKSCLLSRRSSQWASSAPRKLSRINQAKNLDTFQRTLLLISQLSLRQLGPCLRWMSKNGYIDFTLMLSFYVCHLYYIIPQYYTNVCIRCCAGQYRRPSGECIHIWKSGALSR